MSIPPFEPLGFRSRRGFLAAAALASVWSISGCANPPMHYAYDHGREHFSQKKYGRASPKLVADGQPVPRGGGQYLVGHPYSVAGHTYYPSENEGYSAVGMASWYGAAFHGRRTANGEVYDMGSITAAHPTMPLPSYARVTNLGNGYSVIVRVNDRGPYHGGRVMDVSSRTADVLGFKGEGTAKIKVEYVGRAPLEGSDDGVLLASLRTDGSAASLNGYDAPAGTMMASAPQPSLFAALFGSPPAAPSGPLTPPAPIAAPVQVALPEPEPVRVAASELPRAPEPMALEPDEAASERDGTKAFRHAPLPPPRPFDLGATPLLPIGLPSRAATAAIDVLPPRRPVLQASAERALYFAEPQGPKRGSVEPFTDLIPSKDAGFQK